MNTKRNAKQKLSNSLFTDEESPNFCMSRRQPKKTFIVDAKNSKESNGNYQLRDRQTKISQPGNYPQINKISKRKFNYVNFN